MKKAKVEILDRAGNVVDTFCVNVRTTIRAAAKTAWNISTFKNGNEPYELVVRNASLAPLWYKKENL